jgi:putative sterol carrier protein
MSLETLTEQMRERVGEDSGFGATVKFVFEDDSVIFLDGASTPNSVSNEDREADCTIRLTMDDFKNIRAGELDATTAFMMGKLKVEGDMSVAMKLQSVL